MRRVRVYDSMTRETRLFAPRSPPRVGMFVCGLTPYDDAHLGHGRFAVVFDVVARALRRWGYRVLYIQNVTNLDDKILLRAGETGSDPLELAERNFRSWQAIMERLKIESVNHYPRATDYLPEILGQVRELVDRGFAYRTDDGSVYFEVAKFAPYGRLSGQRVEALRPGARVEVDSRKRSPEDFVIWKSATPGEPCWDSPWGPGRPGWHIEDTAITTRLLGEQYDLHGGGLDLIFPHHEAEIALAESATGVAPLVNYWMHNGLLMMGGEKMAKSTGNVSSLEAAIEEFGAMPVRLYYLNAHYRSPLEFTAGESLTEAREAYSRLANPFERLREAMAGPTGTSELTPEVEQASAGLVERLDELLADDFRTREAVAALFTWGRTVLEWETRLDRLSGESLETLAAPYRWAQEVLGLFAKDSGRDPDLEGVVLVSLEARARARSREDFEEADRIREDLGRAGIGVEDGATTRWRKIPPGERKA